MEEIKWKVINENGVFESYGLYEVLVKSNAENSPKYTIYKDEVIFDTIKRELDSKGNIIRNNFPNI